MLVSRDAQSLREQVLLWKSNHETIGLVPTMGFLHEGHLSLVEASRKKSQRTVVSIFVNPTQFGPNEDLASYPRDLDRDLQLLEVAGVDMVFLPSDADMYFSDYSTFVEVEGLSGKLAGGHRPSHFRGVTSVCAKLFNLVQPDFGFFGQKDYQQVRILERMVRDLNFPLTVIMCPIVREPDGLAKSSRNTYLTPDQRKKALVLSQSVALAQKLYAAGERQAEVICAAARKIIESAGSEFEIKYVTIVDPDILEPVQMVDSNNALLVEAYVGGRIRLYDNCIFP